MFPTRYAIFSIALLSLILGGCPGDRHACIIRVGDTCIDRATFEERMNRFAKESGVRSPADLQKLKPVIVNNIVEEEVILRYAQEGRITVSEGEVDRDLKAFMAETGAPGSSMLLTDKPRGIAGLREYVRRCSIIRKAVDGAVPRDVFIAPDQVRTYYEGHQAEFRTPPSVELSQILAASRQAAGDALSLLRSGLPFPVVADRAGSSAGQRGGTGYMGVYARGSLPRSVEDAVFSLPEGGFTGIIESGQGFHVFYVMRKIPGTTIPFAEASEGIRVKLGNERFEKSYLSWIEGLKKEYHVKVDWDEINSMSFSV